jgi:origin recognition complex subunit 5
MWQRLEQSNAQEGATASSRIKRVLNDMQALIGDLELGGVPCGNINSNVTEKGGGAQGLAFELPYVSKLLLLSAYIASRNKPTADRTVFDPSHSRRGRKSSQALDRRSEAAAEAVLRGPGPFSLERLLHIFYCLYEQHGPQGDDQVVDDGQTSPLVESLAFTLQRADVGMQLSSLVTLRLLSTSRGDMLEGLTYRCHITEEVAYAIAANLKVQLTEYLCFTS